MILQVVGRMEEDNNLEVVQAPIDDNNLEVVEVEIGDDHIVEVNDLETVQAPMDDDIMEVVVAQVDGVLMDMEVVEVEMGDDNIVEEDDGMEVVQAQAEVHEEVEIVEVLLADADAELEFMDVFDVINPRVAVELPRVRAPIIHRPAGVRHHLPGRHDIGLLNAVCTHCGARHFACERTSRGHFTLCCNNNQMIIAEGPRQL